MCIRESVSCGCCRLLSILACLDLYFWCLDLSMRIAKGCKQVSGHPFCEHANCERFAPDGEYQPHHRTTKDQKEGPRHARVPKGTVADVYVCIYIYIYITQLC